MGYLAVDIGTTVLNASRVGTSPDERCRTAFQMNPQILYGKDVVSRINNAKRQETAVKMQSAAAGAVLALREELFGDEEPQGIVIAGNTVMSGLLLGRDITGLAEAPFDAGDLSAFRGEYYFGDTEPAETGIRIGPIGTSGVEGRIAETAGADVGFAVKAGVEGSLSEMDGAESSPAGWSGVKFDRITVFPGIGPFLGGDITAGIYATELDRAKEPTLLIDLGTNGEIVLAAGGDMVGTSVAAGPAFEGGNISCGMPASEGAVSGVRIRRGFCQCDVIGGGEARGICGSGLFSAVSAMAADGIIDDYGCFWDERFREEGFPIYMDHRQCRLSLYAEDIRSFLMAKAAVRAGTEALLLAAGMDVRRIARVLIAGSFGRHVKEADVFATGLLPGTFAGKLVMVGNSSLRGAEKLAAHPEDLDRVKEIAGCVSELQLADDDAFKKCYIERMDLRS